MYNYIFDIGGVLVRYDYKKVIEILVERTGKEYSSIENLFKHECLYRIETGRISCQEFYKNQILDVMPGITYEAWIEAFTGHFEANPEGVELLMQLKKQGRDVYILSNLAEFHKIAIERKIPDFFNMCKKNFFSYELGYHKPEREIYSEVCNSIGAKPENCVFLDDVPANIEGAISFGMTGIVFSNEKIASIREQVFALEDCRK